MEKHYLIVGNWKMNQTPKSSKALVQEIVEELGELPPQVEVGICPPFTSLETCAEGLKGSAVALGSQNVYHQEKGAFTGEIAPDMLKELGVRCVIVGHSERRSLFHETNQDVHLKLVAAQKHHLTPILCVGETLQERENGQAFAIIEEQVKIALEDVKDTNFVIAYEPVWAIGTGKTATPEIAQEVHEFIRNILRSQFSEQADKIQILYGGSMKPSNAKALLEQPDITGGLIGGASLVAKDFAEIVRAARECIK